MFTTFSYEIAAIFVLSALLMYGTLSGFLPRMLRTGKLAPLVLALLACAYALYRFSPELSAGLRSMVANAPSATPPPEPRAPRSATSPASHRKPAKSAARATASVVEEPAPVAVTSPAPTIAPARSEASAAMAPAAGEDNLVSPPDSSDDPYDSGIKRAVKRVGRFLHIGRRKDAQ